MFNATITVGLEHPVHVSGQIVPYDLQVLREHILARGSRGARVEVKLPPAARQAFARAFRDLATRGIDFVIS
jgi:hypothetical protein